MTTKMFQANIDLHQLQHWMAQMSIADRDHAVHRVLVESFGDKAPRPHRVVVPRLRSQTPILYGYTTVDQDQLKARSQTFADPTQSAIIPADTIMTKEMPDNWQEGESLAFDLRLRPVIRTWRERTSEDSDFPDQTYINRTRWEIDPYARDVQQRKAQNLPLRDRAIVYGEWLDAVVRRQGGASIDLQKGLSLQSFRMTPNSHKRNLNLGTGPEIILHGNLAVKDPQAFASLISTGAGRHRAYGYGMLLLRALPR